MLKPSKVDESCHNENGTSSTDPMVPTEKKGTSSFMLVQERSPSPITIKIAKDKLFSKTKMEFESVLCEGQDTDATQIDKSLKSNHQEQMINTATCDDDEDVGDDDDEPESISGDNPTVVILDDTKIESTEIEVKILGNDSQSPKLESVVEVNHDHGYSQSTISTSTGNYNSQSTISTSTGNYNSQSTISN